MEENLSDKYETNIYVVDNVLDHDFCDEIIGIIDKLPLDFMQHSKLTNVECYLNNLDKSISSFDEFYFFPNDSEFVVDKVRLINNINNVSINSLISVKTKIVKKINELSELFENINSKIFFDYRCDLYFRKIYGSTRLHTDDIVKLHKSHIHSLNENSVPDNFNMIRKYTMIFALNSDFEGGIFNFPTKNTTFKMKKGSVAIFPPYWTHPHEVSSVLNGKFRYTINTWLMENIGIY